MAMIIHFTFLSLQLPHAMALFETVLGEDCMPTMDPNRNKRAGSKEDERVASGFGGRATFISRGWKCWG